MGGGVAKHQGKTDCSYPSLHSCGPSTFADCPYVWPSTHSPLVGPHTVIKTDCKHPSIAPYLGMWWPSPSSAPSLTLSLYLDSMAVISASLASKLQQQDNEVHVARM